MASVDPTPIMIYKRQAVDDGTLEDCEPDNIAVIILAIVISVTVVLAAVGFFFWRRARAKREQRKLAWRDFVPQWLNFGNGPTPEMSQYPGSFAGHSSYNGYGGYPTPAASDFSQGGQWAGQQTPGSGSAFAGSGYFEGSSFTAGSGGSRRYRDADEYSINSYESDARRTPRTPRTPMSSKQRAYEDAWKLARSGSSGSAGRTRPSRSSSYDEEDRPRPHRSRSHRR